MAKLKLSRKDRDELIGLLCEVEIKCLEIAGCEKRSDGTWESNASFDDDADTVFYSYFISVAALADSLHERLLELETA